MALTTVFGSIGFVARFVIAIVVLAFVSSQNRDDASVRKGFILLCTLGAVVFVLGMLIIFGVFAASGIGLLGNALTNFHYHNFF
ncbi:MAG: hypothetical protein IKT63_01995 [Oscillospiraceae bacterium]|nr:hypothetical protein [Oscillospiraceae bacterium]